MQENIAEVIRVIIADDVMMFQRLGLVFLTGAPVADLTMAKTVKNLGTPKTEMVITRLTILRLLQLN